MTVWQPMARASKSSPKATPPPQAQTCIFSGGSSGICRRQAPMATRQFDQAVA